MATCEREPPLHAATNLHHHTERSSVEHTYSLCGKEQAPHSHPADYTNLRRRLLTALAWVQL